MRSFIRGLVEVMGVFFPMVVFLLAITSQLFRNTNKKPFKRNADKEIISEKSGELALHKQADSSTYLLFEKLTR